MSLLPVGLALLVSATSQPLLIAGLSAAGVLDHPCRRSCHSVATPRGGGIGVLLGIAAGAAVWPGSPRGLVVALLATAAMGLIGLVDDVRALPAGRRLVLQLAVATSAGWGLLGGAPAAAYAWMAVPVAAGWLVAATNAFNFMDGVNGIAAGTAVLAGSGYAYLGWANGLDAVLALGALIASAALGFLPFNAPTARIFLGDAGSYALGAALAVAAALAVSGGVAAPLVLAPLSVFLVDSGWTLALRMWRRQPLLQAHRGHVYQRLVVGGWTHSHAATLAVTTAAIVTVLARLGQRPGLAAPSAILAVLVLIGYLAAPGLVARPFRPSRLAATRQAPSPGQPA